MDAQGNIDLTGVYMDPVCGFSYKRINTNNTTRHTVRLFRENVCTFVETKSTSGNVYGLNLSPKCSTSSVAKYVNAFLQLKNIPFRVTRLCDGTICISDYTDKSIGYRQICPVYGFSVHWQ